MRKNKKFVGMACFLIFFTFNFVVGIALADDAFMTHKPYDGLKNINCFFDHQTPTRWIGGEDVNYSDSIVIFTGETLPNAGLGNGDGSCTLGFNCYSGHGGYDYQMNLDSVYAVADGTIADIKINNPVLGNAVYLNHPSGYVTQYLHLDIIDPALEIGNSVRAGDQIGISGDTGNAIGFHLDFTVIGPNGISTDPFGWWKKDMQDPWAPNPTLWKSSNSVNTTSVGFQQFGNAANWHILQGVGAQGENSLYTYASNYVVGASKWENWAFWTGYLEQAGSYTVKAYVPNPANEAISTEATYYVYHKNGVTSITINQSNNAGNWISLGTYEFEKGANAAVRLVDEATDPANHNAKIILADTILWELAADVSRKADLTFLQDSITITEYTAENQFQYEIKGRIKNIGTLAATTVSVCFKPNSGSNENCKGSGAENLLTISPDAEYSFTLFLFREMQLINEPLGILKINSGNPEENLDNNTMEVPRSVMKMVELPGGIDFTNTELVGLEIVPNLGGVKFIIKSREAGMGDQVIDPQEQSYLLNKIFFQALTIPNEKHWVSLDAEQIGPDTYQGIANYVSPFEQTDMIEKFLKADLQLKSDNREGNPIVNYASLWEDIIRNSNFWDGHPYIAMHKNPIFTRKIYIAPDGISANQTGNTIFFNDINLKIISEWDSAPSYSVDLTPYHLSPEQWEIEHQMIVNYLSQLNIYTEQLDALFNEHAERLTQGNFQIDESLMQEDYKLLKSIYAVVAAAQWYKEQVILNPDIPYASLVDSENLANIIVDAPFDNAYWNDMAFQFVEPFPCNGFGIEEQCGWVGGVELKNSETSIAGALDQEQDVIVEEILGNYNILLQGDSYYSFGGNAERILAELYFGEIWSPLTEIVPGQRIVLPTEIVNEGPLGTTLPIQVRISDTVTGNLGDQQTMELEPITVDPLSSWSERKEWLLFSIPEQTGSHELTLVINSEREIREGYFLNNHKTIIVTVAEDPLVSIIQEFNGSAEDVEIGEGVSLTENGNMLYGEFHECELVEGVVYCSGNNAYGQLGLGHTLLVNGTARVSDGDIVNGNNEITQLAVGAKHNCIIKNSSVYCWGDSFYGQTGSGGFWLNNSSPVSISGLNLYFTNVIAGERHTCAQRQMGGIGLITFCWGRNNLGQLGDATLSHRNAPSAVQSGEMPSATNIRQLALGKDHTCAIANDGLAYCWGDSSFGQLGNNNTISHNTPVKVINPITLEPGLPLDTITAENNGNETCGTKDDINYCWGNGQLIPFEKANYAGIYTHPLVESDIYESIELSAINLNLPNGIEVQVSVDSEDFVSLGYLNPERGSTSFSLSENFENPKTLQWRLLFAKEETGRVVQVKLKRGLVFDNDGDGIDDRVDVDDDNDSVLDENDTFPLDPTESADADVDGIGDNADTDDDNDGVLDADDAFPFDPNESIDTDGDGVGDSADTDDDNDGVLDASDLCAGTANGQTVDANGCPVGDGPLLLDGDMEQLGTGSWVVYGAPNAIEKDTEVIYSGTRSMHVDSVGTSSGFQQRNIPVEAGVRYQLRMRYQVTGNRVRIKLGANDSNKDYEGKFEYRYATNGEWMLYERIFIAPETSDFRLVITAEDSEIYTDDILIEEYAGEPPIVIDGDMEGNGLMNWRAYGVPVELRKDAAVVADGLQSMWLDTTGVSAGFQQRYVPVEVGVKYRLSVKYRLEGNRGEIKLGDRSSNSDYEGKHEYLYDTAGAWQTYERIFEAPHTSDFRLVILSENSRMYVDEVKIEALPQPILDGNMEAEDSLNWLPYGVPNELVKTTDIADTGERSLELDALGTGAGFQQRKVPLEAGQSYKIIVRYQVSGYRMRLILGANSSNSDFEGKYEYMYDTAGTWQTYERVLTVPETSDFRVVFVGYDSIVHVDNVIIETYDGAPPIVADGDMESAGIAAWRPYGLPVSWGKNADVVYAGEQSMLLDTRAGVFAGIQQRYITVEAGVTYRLRAVYQAEEGSLMFRLGAGTSNTDFEGVTEELTSVEGWQIYERIFTAPETTDFRLIIIGNNSLIYLDDVVIEVVVE